MARETVDMFHYLTEGVSDTFLRPELADRLAAMLGITFFLLITVGISIRCKRLKLDQGIGSQVQVFRFYCNKN